MVELLVEIAVDQYYRLIFLSTMIDVSNITSKLILFHLNWIDSAIRQQSCSVDGQAYEFDVK